MLDRIAGIQLEVRLLNSLAVCAEERGAYALGREHVAQSLALLRVCNVWLAAARQYEEREAVNDCAHPQCEGRIGKTKVLP